jgi:hypothetical protein
MRSVAVADPASAAARALGSVALRDRLASFDATSRDSNLAWIGFGRDSLCAFGVASRLTHDPTAAKADLHATIGPMDAPGGALCGDGTSRRWTGRTGLRIRSGRAGHAARPARAADALRGGAGIVSLPSREQARIVAEGPHHARVHPPRTSCHAGVLRSASALSIVPHAAEIASEWRHIPALDARMPLDGLRARAETVPPPPMPALHPAAAITVGEGPRQPGMDLAEDHPLADPVRAPRGASETGRVAAGTEGGAFPETGQAAIVSGLGDIARSRMPGAWIAESDPAARARLLAGPADRLAA